MYYKRGTWVYWPDKDPQIDVKFAYKYQFGAPEFHEDAPDTLRRKVLKGDFKGTWHSCIELN